MSEEISKDNANQSESDTGLNAKPIEDVSTESKGEKTNCKNKANVSNRFSQERLIMWATIIIAGCNIFLVLYTHQQISENREANEIESSAYIAMGDVVINWEGQMINGDSIIGDSVVGFTQIINSNVKNPRFTMTIPCANVGKTPAYNVHQSQGFTIVDTSLHPHPVIPIFEDSKRPKFTVGQQTQMIFRTGSSPITREEFNSIFNGRKNLLISGEVTYEDVFHYQHTTRFYVVYTPIENHCTPYGEHNDAD